MRYNFLKKIKVVASVAILFISCEDKAPTPSGAIGKSLTEYKNIPLGFGLGIASRDVYVGFMNGNMSTFKIVDKDDRATQEKIDFVMSGYNGLVIDAPAANPFTYSLFKYCEGWKVKKSTMITYLNSSDGIDDVVDFENIKTDTDLMSLYEKVKHRNSNSYYGSEGGRFLFKTEERITGIGYIHEVNGTGESESSNVVITFKVIKP